MKDLLFLSTEAPLKELGPFLDSRLQEPILYNCEDVPDRTRYRVRGSGIMQVAGSAFPGMTESGYRCKAFEPELKGSVGEGPNHSNHSNHSNRSNHSNHSNSFKN